LSFKGWRWLAWFFRLDHVHVGMMGRVSIEHLFRQVQGQHKALAREGSFVFVLILHGSIDSFIEKIPAM